MGDIFDGIDLEDLANSESPVIEEDQLSAAPPAVEPAAKPSTEGDNQEKPQAPDTSETIDLEALANAETVADENELETNTSGNSSEEDGNEDDGGQASPTPADDNNGSSPSSQDALTSLASALVEAGVFSSLEEEDITDIKDVDTLLGAVGKQIQYARYADLNDNQKKYLDAMENGVPHESYAEKATTSDTYRQLDDSKIKESPQLAGELIRRSFIAQGVNPQTALKYADMAVKAGTAGEDAIAAKAELIKISESEAEAEIQEAKAAKEAERKLEQDTIAALKSKVKETTEILPGLKINAPTRDKVFTSMTAIADMDKDTPRNEVMKSYAEDSEYKMKLHAIHVLTNGLKDFSKFTKMGKSKAAEDLRNKLAQSGAGASGSAGKPGVQTEVAQGMTSAEIAKQLGLK